MKAPSSYIRERHFAQSNPGTEMSSHSVVAPAAASVRAGIFLFFAAALATTPSVTLGQQQVRGSVLDGDGHAPIEGAMVILLQGEQEMTRVLTTVDGSFRLNVAEPGRYSLRVDRIGYASQFSGVFDLGAGAVVQRTISTNVRPIVLAGFEVETSRRCEVRPSEGLATGRVWEEARKALAAAEWTSERGLYQFVWMRFVQSLNSSGRRVLSEERTRRRDLTNQPFSSVSPEVLASEGFRQTRGEEVFYAAPDASVLLSDSFLDTHCLALEEHEEDPARLVGIRFEPIPDRELPEIEGVLWLEREGGRLRSVEYRYVNLEYRVTGPGAGGEILFRELPNGTWIVQEWSIRLPRVLQERNPYGQTVGYRVLGYKVEGGVVDRVATSGGELIGEDTALGRIEGIVSDSLGRPAAGARVWVEGTDLEAESGPGGVFTITGVTPGTWSVGASHPTLEIVGHPGVFQEVPVERGGIRSLVVSLPSVHRAALERCLETPSGVGEAELIGRIVDESGSPVAGGHVRASWTDYGPAGLAVVQGPIQQVEEGFEIRADERGVFAYCNVPTYHTVTLLASRAPLPEYEAPMRLDDDRWRIAMRDPAGATTVEVWMPEIEDVVTVEIVVPR